MITCPTRTMLTVALLATVSTVHAEELLIDVAPKAAVAQSPSPFVIIQAKPGQSAAVAAWTQGLAFERVIAPEKGWQQFRAQSVESARIAVEALRLDPSVAWVWHSVYCNIVPHAFTPNDPYFVPVATFGGQWHLKNNITAGLDLNVVPAWNRDITGVGVRIGIVDDSVQGSHPDLAPNFSAADSYDFFAKDTDPSPEGTDKHGVSVAGCAAARGGNSAGVTGVAPFASLAGLRIAFSSATVDSDIFEATRFHSIGSTPTIQIKNHSYGYSGPYIADTIAKQGMEDSAAAGTIHCFSAGNSRGTSAQDANKQDILTSPNVIAVAALGSNGVFSNYSSFGANVFCTAPSSGSSLGITTTDRVGTGQGYDGFVDNDYTAGFGGTSAASPEVAGVMALVKQVRPNAEVRFAKHMLARACKIVDPNDFQASADGGWRANSAGIKFNPNYGFGLVDADAVTLRSALYSGVTAPATWQSPTINVGLAIPDNNVVGLSQDFYVPTNSSVETAQVHIEATHPGRGNIEVVLTSPSGLAVKVGRNSTSDLSADLNWTYLANAFWGELSKGTWRVEVRDRAATRVGTWDKVWLRINTGAPIANQSVTGTVVLNQFTGVASSQSATLSLREPGTTNEIAVIPAVLANNGTFTASGSGPDGTYDAVLKVSHWLGAKQSNVVFTRGATGLSFSVINGDCDGDNSVSLFDYLILSDAFDTSVGDASFDVRADLDGDSVVSLFDYLILSENFDLQGM